MTKTLLTLVAALLMGAATAYAADTAANTAAVGVAERDLFIAILTGNIGLILGLSVTVVGIFSFVKGNTSGGLITILLGVLITMVPGIYSGLRLIACPIAQSLGGNCGGSS